MYPVYRLLSFIINSIAFLLAVSVIFSIPLLFSSSATMLSAFIMLAVILYSWFSFQFRRQVLQKREVVRHTLKDWVRVNGIVTLIFCFMTIISVTSLLQNPQSFTSALKGIGLEVPLKSITGLFYGMLVYAVLLFVHILWTFSLMKKNQEFFQ